MRVIQCDRCGSTYPIDGNNFVVRVIANNRYSVETEKSYDVCTHCLECLGCWLPGIKEEFLSEERRNPRAGKQQAEGGAV